MAASHRVGIPTIALLATLLAACTITAPDRGRDGRVRDEAPPPVARQLDADTRITMSGGASFTAPRGWFVTERARVVLLEDPDRSLSVALVERDEPKAEAAIAAAWKLAQPTFSRRVRRTVRPLPDPWDDVVRLEYETTTAEARVVVGTGRRAGTTWYVVLLDGPRAAVDRRSAQVNTMVTGLRAPGMRPESWQGRTAHVLDEARAARFEAFVEDARARARVPGAAVAVVQRGRIVYEKGFGVREAGRPDPVTPDTLFMIGSITKSLTSLMMAALVDQGRFTWDTPVTELMPSFTLGDADATRRLTMKHTVCACTGLPRQDMELFFGYTRATPESRVGDLRTMVPTTGFGETFQYSNPMVSAGGYIAARARHPELALGPAFDRAIHEVVLTPLGMGRTTFDFAVVERTDHASPHGNTLAGEPAALPLSVEHWLPPIRPAGGAWSSARDMARYVLAELAGGATPDGRAVASSANMLKRREPQVKINAGSSYALALGIDTVRGLTVIGPGGSTSGFSAAMFFLPDHDAGGIILTNAWGAFAFTSAVRGRLLELLFDGQERAARGFEIALAQRAESLATERPKIETAPPPASWRRWIGTYQNGSLGRIRVMLEGDRAVLDAGDWRIAVGRKKDRDGTVRLVLLEPPWTYFELIAEEASGRPRLIIDRPQMRYVFERTD